MELFGIVQVWQFGHPSYEIVEISLSFIHDLIIYQRDGFFGDGGYETTGKSLDYGFSHFIEFIEPAVHIDGAILISSHDVIYHIVHEGVPCLMAVNIDLYIFSKL